MMALKMTIIAMMISSSVIPVNNGNINKAIECPRVSEVINYAVSKDTSALNTKETADTQVTPIEQAMPVEDAVIIQQAVTVKEAEPVRYTINIGKTYEQCMKEAFENTYLKTNKLLDEITANSSKDNNGSGISKSGKRF